MDGLRFIANTAVIVLHLPLDLAGRNPVDLQLPIMGPLVVGLPAVFFVLVGRPCRDKAWPRRLADRARRRRLRRRTRPPG